MKFKRILVAILAIAMLGSVMAGCGKQETSNQGSGGEQKAPAKKWDISFGTGGTGGVYMVVGTAMANLINEKLSDVVRVTPEPAPALTQTARFVNSGEFTLGMVSGDTIKFARDGLFDFKGEKNPNIEIFCAGHRVGMAYVVMENSTIKSLQDFKGKKIGVTSASMFRPTLELLKEYGIQENEVTPVYITFAQQVDALKTGSIDVAIESAFPRTSAMIDLTEGSQVRLISADKDKMDKFLEKYPYFRPREMPAGTYKGQDKAYAGSPGQYLFTAINSKTDTELVYKMFKVVMENSETFAKTHAACQEYTLDQFKKFIDENAVPAPIHPGVVKYLQEKGVKVPDNLTRK